MVICIEPFSQEAQSATRWPIGTGHTVVTIASYGFLFELGVWGGFLTRRQYLKPQVGLFS